MGFLRGMFTPGDYMPHGFCYGWEPGLVWLHVISDSLIFLAYMSIPFSLVHILRRRKDLPFNWIFICFGVFIVACGLTHGLEVWNLWHAAYWLAGAVKAVTAVASVTTAILLIKLTPQVLKIPSVDAIQLSNDLLAAQGAALRASDAKFRGILESAPDAMVIADGHGRIVLVNAETERLFGYTSSELIGLLVETLVPERFRGKHPQERKVYTDYPRTRSMGEGRDLWGLRKDNTEFPVEISLSPIETPEGTLISSAIRDVSVRKEAERLLTNMEKRYRGLLDAAPDPMVVVNQSGEIVLLNVQAEKQFGYGRHELVGQTVKKIIPQGLSEHLLADATRTPTQAVAQQVATRIELDGQKKDETHFPIEVMLSPLDSPEGTLLTAAIRDISVRKQSDAEVTKLVSELKRSNDDLQQFAYVASHDLQEPLRMVASYTQLLASRYKGRLDADADEFISYAVDGSSRMQALIQDLLLYSRAGTNGKPPIEISAENALKLALSNLEKAIQDSGAVVTHDALPAITADDTQLCSVLQNLVSNAIKYRGVEAPVVHVSASKNGANEWIFSVKDNGMGIDPRYFERIFVIFQRLHGRTEFEGTGIGLAICKKIVDRMGGRIWVESQLKKGSTFFFALPGRDGK